MGAGSNMNTLINTAVANQGNHGIWLNASSNMSLLNTAVAHSGGDGYHLVNSDNNYFTGLFKVGDSAVTNCSTSGTNPGIDNACNPQGPLSDFGAPDIGISLAASFVGKASSDTVNADGASGTFPYNSITDWTDFENVFRGWGTDGSAFPNINNIGPCAGGDTCRIWDWSLASADAVVRNVVTLPTGNDTITHTWSDASTTTFLRNAVEIMGDGIGDENGLCGSNETCLFTPNIGSYQGHGNLVSAGAFTDGAIAGVTLMQYETNGR